MTYPGVIFWVLLIWSMYSRGSLIIYLFICSMAFGSLAVIPPAISGGATITAEPVCALFFMLKLLLNRPASAWMASAAFQINKLGILSLFAIVAIVGAVFFPRIFAGTIVIPVRSVSELAVGEPLVSSATNITQSGYLILSCLTVFSTAYSVMRPQFQKHLLRAMLYGGAVTVLTGVADMGTQLVGLQALLGPFRNATYSLLTDDTILGAKRVVGLMPEASSYGPLCISFAVILTVLRPYFQSANERRICLVLTGLLLAMGWLSTSSTAILCLVVFAFVFALDWLRRATNKSAPGRSTFVNELYILIAALIVGFILIVFDQKIFESDMAMVDHLIFDKTGSSSYVVRSLWNHISWQALLDTHGVGVGVGGTRSSNWIIALFSNTGFVGGGLFMLFLLQIFMRRPGMNPYIGGLVTSFKFSLFVPLVGTILSGSSPDFGNLMAILFGSITGCSLMNEKARASRAPIRPDAVVF